MASKRELARLAKLALGIRKRITTRNALEQKLRAVSPSVGYAAIVSIDTERGSHKIYIEPISPGFPTIRLGFMMQVLHGTGTLSVTRLVASGETLRWNVARSVTLGRSYCFEHRKGNLVEIGWCENAAEAGKWAASILAAVILTVG